MASMSSAKWHASLIVLPRISGETVENFVSLQSIAKDTSIRGYKFYLEGYIHDVQVCDAKSADGLYSVRSKCFRSMRKSEAPHKVEVMLNDCGQPVEWSCTCAAGRAMCHHAVALVYQLQHYQKLDLAVVPPILSKTSLPQTWHLPPRFAGIQRRAVTGITVQKPKKPAVSAASQIKHTSTEGVKSKIYNPLSVPLQTVSLPQLLCPFMESVSPAERPQFTQLWDASCSLQTVECQFGNVPRGSVLSYQMPVCGVESGNIITVNCDELPPDIAFPDHSNFVITYLPVDSAYVNVYNSLCVSEALSKEFEQATCGQAATDQWHRLRKNRLTASTFKRVCSRKADFESLASNLMTTRNATTAAMKHGIQNEPVAAEMYARSFGRNVFPVGFVINPSCFFLGASPDRRVFDPDEIVDKWGLLEIKCTEADTVSSCDYLIPPRKSDSNQLKLKTNHDYYYQVIGQMGITGATWCDFFVYAKDDFYVERIPFDERFFSEMMSKLCSFFFGYFLPKIIC